MIEALAVRGFRAYEAVVSFLPRATGGGADDPEATTGGAAGGAAAGGGPVPIRPTRFNIQGNVNGQVAELLGFVQWIVSGFGLVMVFFCSISFMNARKNGFESPTLQLVGIGIGFIVMVGAVPFIQVFIV